MKRDIFGWLGVVLLLLGGLTLSAPFVLQAIDSAGQTASAEAAALPTPDGRRMIEEAKAYNEGLSARPQSVLGEVGDTFSGTSYSGGDKECRGLLDADGGGTMGAVRYPRLHISLPVRHGTDAATLERSAGHLSGIPARVVRAAVLNGDMPACYAGSTIMRIRRTDLDEWVANLPVDPPTPK